ncbi:unnamed protein product [Prorocentrum cordatum]|uniref:Uncharacterized protein n=1 Tax=Prorocentrum cordatum TaxID=2364126 RepID=A0ABN9WDW3_9DINO|nr:unnamed protein product [Polarella glacialis]
MRYTLASLSSEAGGLSGGDAWRPWAEWKARGPPRAVLLGGLKCRSFGDSTRFVVFRFRFEAYFDRHRGDAVVESVRRFYLSDADAGQRRQLDAIGACVPRECCFHQPQGSNASAMDGLRSVLFYFVFHFKIGLAPGEVVPEPVESDFEGIFTINLAEPDKAWVKCHRD